MTQKKAKGKKTLPDLTEDHLQHILSLVESDIEMLESELDPRFTNSVPLVPLEQSQEELKLARDFRYILRRALSGTPIMIEIKPTIKSTKR